MKATDTIVSFYSRSTIAFLSGFYIIITTPLQVSAQSVIPPSITYLEPIVVPEGSALLTRKLEAKILIKADGTAQLSDSDLTYRWKSIVEQALVLSRFVPAKKNGEPVSALVKVQFSILEDVSKNGPTEQLGDINDQKHDASIETPPLSYDLPEYSTTARIKPLVTEVGITETVSSEHIDKTHPTSTDEVLQLVPGIKIVQHGSEGKGHQILIRGFDAVHGSDVEVLVEGVSINEPSNIHGQGYLDLYGIIPETVLEMKSAKGPFLPWQTNFGIAGSISFHLGIPADLRPGFVRMEIDHHNRMRVLSVAAPKDLSPESFFAAEILSDPGFGPDRQARRSSLVSGYRLQLNGNDTLTALAIGQTARFESPGALRLSDVSEKGFDFYDTYLQAGEGLSDKALAKLGYEHNNKNTFINFFIYGIARDFALRENFTGWLMNEFKGDGRLQQHRAFTGGGKFSLRQVLPTPFRSDFLAGAGWRIDAIDQKESQVDLSAVPWQINRKLTSEIQYVPIYTAVSLSPYNWFQLTPSMRFDLFYYNARDETDSRKVYDTLWIFSPKLATNFPLDESVTLFAGYGRGFRSPEARALAAPSRESIEDERLSQYTGGEAAIVNCDAVEAGLELDPLEMLKFKLTGFATWLQHEVVFDHVSNTNLEMDGTRRLGVEFVGTLSLSSWLTTSSEIIFVDARFNRSNNFVPGAPRWMGTFRLSLGAERGPQAGARLFWVGNKRPLAHGAFSDGYVQLNIDVGWRFEKFAITALINNLFDAEIMEGVYHFASWFDRTEQRSLIPKIHFVAAEPFTFRVLFTAYL